MSLPIVLCYHALSDRWPADLSLRPERFSEQLELLVRRGYRGATFLDVVEGRATGKAVAVTFDDAYRSVMTLARPVLERLELPGSVYAVTAFVGSERPMSWPGVDQWVDGEHGHELLPLSWAELRELAEAGWEVGSHTRTHPRLTTLSDADLADELGRSRAACEDGVGRACRSLAYPYGDVDRRVSLAAGEAGYAAAGTLPARFHPAAPLEWPRIGVYRGDDLRRFRLKVSPAGRRLRGSPAWRALERLRG